MILNNNNVDIFICSHKQFEKPVHNDIYKTLSVGNNTELYGDNIIKDNTGDNISNMNIFYGEMSGIYWLWKNYNIKEYVGICHHRRYFEFLDNLPDNIKTFDIILPTPEQLNENIYNHYSLCHNKDDIRVVMDIMVNKYQVPIDIVNEVFNRDYMHCRNMFICNKTFFNEYCEFAFGILNDYLKYHKISNMNDVYKMVEKNKDKYFNYDIHYQSRLGGFLGERILNVFVAFKKLKIKYINIIELN